MQEVNNNQSHKGGTMKKALIFALFLFSACGQVGDDMTTKIIADSIISEDHFLSATEQAGGRIEQPEPATANTGSFKLVSKGTIVDLDYSGTATTDGAGGGTTVIDSLLAVYGDDYLIDGTVTITDFLQDSADYTESDPAGRVTLSSANVIAVTNLDDDEEAWVVIDMTADHFDGDFEFHTQINCESNNASGDTCGVWAVANTVDTLTDIDVASGDYLAVYWHDIPPASNYLVVEECNGGTVNSTVSTTIMSMATEYYLKIKRDESVGTYGTLYCYIYSDVTHETLVETLTLTLTQKQDFRYLYWMVAKESGGTGAAWSGTIQNFQIVASETKTITDSAQATGTLTTGAFTYQVNTGTVFALNVDIDTRDFAIELTTSGDAGDATFKWSHDGGATYLGRDDPNQANWLGNIAAGIDVAGTGTSPIVQAADGRLLMVMNETGTGKIRLFQSTNKGITWSELVNQLPAVSSVYALETLKSGRILGFGATGLLVSVAIYSDDNGATWAYYSDGNYTSDLCELSSGDIYAVAPAVAIGEIGGYISIDEGRTFTLSVKIATDTRDQNFPAVVEANNGDIVVVYETDETVLNEIEIKCKISSDGGTTFGSVIDVIDYTTGDLKYPRIIKDINGDLYCVVGLTSSGLIVYSISTDNGATWGAQTTLYSDSGANAVAKPSIVLVDGHQILCSMLATAASPTTTMVVRRGIWESYSANDCPAALNGLEQKLICETGIGWYGGAGITGDIWTMDEVSYDYSMANLVIPSPARPWRSDNDNIACSITLDAGANARFYCTGIGMFNTNFRTANFMMNATDVWTGPSVDESLSTDVTTAGVIDSVSGNYIQDAALMASYKDHELSSKGKAEKYFLRALNGTDAGLTWEILDNIGDYIVLDTTAVHNMATDDTFVIFRSWVADTFTGGIYRFIHITIPIQQTSDDYYQIGTMVSGIATALSRQWGIGMGHDYTYDIDLMTTPRGGGFPIKGADRKRNWKLVWRASETTRKEMLAIADYTEARPMVLIPDAGTMAESYLVHKTGGIPQTNRFHEKFDFTVKLIEVI